MKLFVWNEPYPVAYGGSCVFALGQDVEDARESARRAGVWRYGPKRHDAPDYSMPPKADIEREPDLVMDEGAAAYEWAE